MNPNFIKLLEALSKDDIEFVLVGGIAANFHGSAMATYDCDVVVALDAENLQKLAKALSPFSPTFRHKHPPQVFDEQAAAREGWKNIYLDTNAGVLDCLGQIKGLGNFSDCKVQSLEVDLGDFTIRVLSLDALITAKKAMGRPKDLQTVMQLEISRELKNG